MNRIPRSLRLVAVFGALVLFAAACSGGGDVVAEVDGGGSLTQDDVVEGVAASVGDAALDASELATIDKSQAAGLITDWARNELFYAELADRDVAIDPAYFDNARADIEEQIAQSGSTFDLDTLQGQVVIRGNALGEIVADYLLAEGEPTWPEQLCSSHILVGTQDEARAVVDRLDAGEDFADLARELSIGPTGPDGGDLGCVDPAGFVPEFVDGARTVENPPGYTGPVQSQFGWHVINVRSFGSERPEDPEAARAALFSTPEFEAFRAAALTHTVEVDPRYGVWDPTSSSVVAG